MATDSKPDSGAIRRSVGVVAGGLFAGVLSAVSLLALLPAHIIG